MKKHRGSRVTWMCMFIILAVIGVLTMMLFYTVDRDSTEEYVVNLNLLDSTLSDKDAGISVTIGETKYWINDEGVDTQSVGAQYDGVITNELSCDIADWQLVIGMAKPGIMDSSWNGEYTLENSMDGHKLIVKPNEDTNLIPSGESKTFGFVMTSQELMKFTTVQFVGYRHVVAGQYKMFWGLAIALVVWFMAAVSIIISDFRTRHFNEVHENDAKIISQTMKVFAEFIDAKDAYTKGHSVRVAYYAKELGRRMRLSEDEVVKLEYIGLMHDCGKIGVPDEVLTKPNNLESDERIKIKEHTIMGGKILEGFTAIEGIRDGALYHHECYDGSGYPEGLKGKEIPLCARIIGVADAYDAMSTNRCYRNRLTQTDIVKELEAGRGTQFDPEIVTHMINMIDEGCCQIDDYSQQ